MDTRSRQQDLYAQIEATTRRVKRAVFYSGSKTTGDFVHGLVAKWLQNDEFDRLSAMGAHERGVGQSVRAFIVDEIRARSAQKRAGVPEPVGALAIPSDEILEEVVADAQILGHVRTEVANLVAGQTNAKAVALLVAPVETGRVLDLTMRGRTNVEIRTELDMPAGTVSNRLQQGIAYLARILHAGRT